jgi:hypothetical protein
MKKTSRKLNWLIWSVTFFFGALLFALIEWHSTSAGAIGWFISVSLWSAFCGIGFTIVEWILWKNE